MHFILNFNVKYLKIVIEAFQFISFNYMPCQQSHFHRYIIMTIAFISDFDFVQAVNARKKKLENYRRLEMGSFSEM